MKAALMHCTGIVFCLASCSVDGPTRINQIQAQSAYTKNAPSDDSNSSNTISLEQQLAQLLQANRQNQVLELMELGKSAMLQNNFSVARDAMDRALLEIETIYSKDKNAIRARSLWYEEGKKTFKGEPYERAMVYLYRGLLYLFEGDYGNARASFEGGILQDAFAEEEQFRADFASLHALSYWSAQKFDQPELAAATFEEYYHLKPSTPLPTREHNVLIVAETGYAPRKLSDGPGHTALVYRRGKGFADTTVSLSLEGSAQDLRLLPMEDLFFQASTRGGRHVDKILDGKLEFQQSSEKTGKELANTANTAAFATRESTVHQSSIGRYVGATKALSALALGIGAKVKPQADTRYWTSLPDSLHIGSMTVPINTEGVTIHYHDSEGSRLGELTRMLDITFDKNGNGVLWVGREPQS